MTPQQIKTKVLAAWLAQMAKYAKGPVETETYCSSRLCPLCDLTPAISDNCGICPLSHYGNEINYGCDKNMTLINLRLNLVHANSGTLTITPALISAIKLRHKFYVRGLVILEALPESRFESGEGFPELVELDRELAETIGE
jgi:hypothetical protein